MAVVAQGEFTFKDLLRGVAFSVFRLYAVLMALLLLFYGISSFLIFGKGAIWADESPYLYGTLTVAAFMVCFTFWLAYQAKQKTPNLRGTVRYEFDDRGVMASGAHSNTETRWPGFVKWHENGTTFLLYVSSRQVNMIPKRFFGSEQDVAAVRELLRANVSRKK